MMKHFLPWNSHSLFNEISNVLNSVRNFEVNPASKHTQLFATDAGWVAQIDLPGFEREEIQLKFEDGTLHIQAQNAQRGDFHFPISLGDEVDTEAISARLDLGILEITLPRKAETQPASKDIEIQ